MNVLSVGIDGDTGGGEVVRTTVNTELRRRGYHIESVTFADIYPAVPSLRALWSVGRMNDADIIHCHSIVGSHALGTALGSVPGSTPLVFHTHTSFLASVSLKERYLLRRLLRFETSMAASIIFVSDFERKRLGPYVSSRPEWFVVENAVEIPHSVPKPVGLPETYLLCVGTVTPRKGQHRAIRALAHLPDHHLILAGEVEMDVQEYARAEGVSDRVTVTGRVDSETLSAMMEHADVLVHLARYESFGLVIPEALARGTPVVCSDACGAKELVNDDVGRIISVHAGPRTIAERITECSSLRSTADTSVPGTDTMIDHVEDVYVKTLTGET